MKQIAEEYKKNVGIGKTISNSIGHPVKQFEAHIKGNYPIIILYASYTHNKRNIIYRT